MPLVHSLGRGALSALQPAAAACTGGIPQKDGSESETGAADALNRKRLSYS